MKAWIHSYADALVNSVQVESTVFWISNFSVREHYGIVALTDDVFDTVTVFRESPKI